MLNKVPTFGINWAQIAGGHMALKYARRDLPNLDAAVKITPTPRMVAVQAGGNLGVWPKRLAQRFQTVYTFEPSPELFPLLVQNAPEPNIVRFQAALGSTHDLVGVSRIRRDGKMNRNHEGITHIAGAGVIPTMRLDDLELPVCNLIYLDTEGWELYGLQGAQETIARCRPVVVVEINKNLQFVGVTEAQITGFIQDCGYQHAVNLGKDQAFVPVEMAS